MSGGGLAIDLGDESGDDSPGTGLLALVVAVVEILIETMEREAIRRMESGRLTDDEIERVGTALRSLEEEVARIKEREGIEDEVDGLRTDLDELVHQAIETPASRHGAESSPSPDTYRPERGEGG